MVRIASVALLFGGCLAEEDVYYHTQLLQTKMNPQKVVVDVDGKTNLKDDVALFQTHLQKKARKASHQKFMSALKAKKAKKLAGPDRGGDEGFGDPPPEAAEECAVYYGHDVDVDRCWECSMTEFMGVDESEWHPDPNPAFRNLCDAIDDCMGQTNLLTQACEGEYGEEVALLDCLMCGMMCECEGPEDRECLECHRGCMSEDTEAWAEEEWEDTEMEHREEEGEDFQYEMCKDLYPPEPDRETCGDCGERCMEAMMSVSPFSEKAAFEEGMSCGDACMGQTNIITHHCQEGYGEDVDVFECFMCGMGCGCCAEHCDLECHGQCMEEDWMAGVGETTWGSSSWGSSSWLQLAKSQALHLKRNGSSSSSSYNGSSSFSWPSSFNGSSSSSSSSSSGNGSSSSGP